MRAEETKLILSAAAIDFLAGDSNKRQVYLYPDELLADGVCPLAYGRCVEVTFKITDYPQKDS